MALSLSPLPPGFIVPCLRTPSVGCKGGPAWVHEIKHDGYRLIARRTDDRVRLYTRRGFNWADRYPRIVEALRSLRVRSITIDGVLLPPYQRAKRALQAGGVGGDGGADRVPAGHRGRGVRALAVLIQSIPQGDRPTARPDYGRRHPGAEPRRAGSGLRLLSLLAPEPSA